jgi:hypothetical protein
MLGGDCVIDSANSPLNQRLEAFNRVRVNVPTHVNMLRVGDYLMLIAFFIKGSIGGHFIGKRLPKKAVRAMISYSDGAGFS